MTKQDILNYIKETPYNTNINVVSGMIDSIVESGSGQSKTEIELLAQENKVYTPADGKVYNKVTVNVPIKEEYELRAEENGTYTPVEGWTYNSVVVDVSFFATAFDFNGGKIGDRDIMVEADPSGTVLDMEDLASILIPGMTVPTGKTFGGFTTVRDDDTTIVSSITTNSNHVLYILWIDENQNG